jgi:hypothetical protein
MILLILAGYAGKGATKCTFRDIRRPDVLNSFRWMVEQARPGEAPVASCSFETVT